jgi:hypothetical protein
MAQEQAAFEHAQTLAEQQKQTGAKQLGDVAGAIHDAAHELEGHLPQAAKYVHSAASHLEEGSAALRERSISELMASFNDLARKQPMTVFGGALLAGFAMSRFLKSSAGNEGH